MNKNIKPVKEHHNITYTSTYTYTTFPGSLLTYKRLGKGYYTYSVANIKSFVTFPTQGVLVED